MVGALVETSRIPTTDILILGGYCSSPTETAINVLPFILSTDLMIQISHQKDGTAAYSLAWYFGTQGNRHIIMLTVRISVRSVALQGRLTRQKWQHTGSRWKKVTGDLLDSQNYRGSSTRTMSMSAPWLKKSRQVSRHMFGFTRTLLAFCGIISSSEKPSLNVWYSILA